MKQWSSIWPTKKKPNDSLSGEPPPAKFYTFFDLTVTGLGSTLGFAISVVIGQLIKNVAGPSVVVSISLAGVAALVGGLCFAEFGVRLLKVDSTYAYCYLWGRETAAFVFGWLLLLEYVAGTASGAKGTVAFIDSLTEYQLSKFLEDTIPLNFLDVIPYFDFLSLTVVAALTILIAFGMKDSLAVKKILTTCEIILIISIIAAGAFKADLNNWDLERGETDEEFKGGFIPFGVLGVAKGAAIAFYGFIGFDTVSIAGNEIKSRKRNLPLAITTTVILTLAANAGVGAILTLILPFYKHDINAAVPSAFQQLGWTAMKWIVAVFSFCGFQTSLFGATFSLPTTIYAMANDGLLFHCLGNNHSKLKIPVAASLTGGLVAAVAAGFIPFKELLNLTVMGTLLVFTILAINIILLRYSSKTETEEHISESWPQLVNINSDTSVKAIMKNCFRFTAKNPTNLTKKIILGNLTLFCLCSVGISVIFNFFNEPLIACALEALIPAGILLSILFLNMISIMCQPKSLEVATFQVPLVPFLPCLSIFLNTFLILTFESLTWILFSSWMAVGIVCFGAWRLIKHLRKEVGENSLYEINRTNAVKLSDSIWKIKSEKKSFYEGAINLAFYDDLDEPKKDVNGDISKQLERTSLRLKEVDDIQKADAVEEEKGKPWRNEQELSFCYAKDEEIESNLPEDGKVQWECVAEIHTEDELPQETVALEIVDNTYNFLSELSKDDGVQSTDTPVAYSESNSDTETHENNTYDRKNYTRENNDFQSLQPVVEKSLYPSGNGYTSFQEELYNKTKKRFGNSKKVLNDESTDSDPVELISAKPFTSSDADDKEITIKGTPKSKTGVNNKNNVINLEPQDAPSVPSQDQNKVKEFKEKLNQLLKNQINGGTNLSKNLPISKTNVGVEDDSDDEKNGDILRKSVKTLNKSQIKGKLELLLSKGPPKRPSLGSSFNIKIKEEVTEGGKPEEKLPQGENFQISNGEDGGKKPALDLASKTEKAHSVESGEVSNDVCC